MGECGWLARWVGGCLISWLVGWLVVGKRMGGGAGSSF